MIRVNVVPYFGTELLVKLVAKCFPLNYARLNDHYAFYPS